MFLSGKNAHASAMILAYKRMVWRSLPQTLKNIRNKPSFQPNAIKG